MPFALSETSPSIIDWIQAAAGAVSAGLSIGLLVQLKQTKQQIAASNQWNKLNAAFTYFQSDSILAKETAAVRALDGVGYKMLTADTPISPEQLSVLREKTDDFQAVKDLLNIAEDFSTAVHLGALDTKAAYGMMAILITRWESLLKPVILERRAAMKSEAAYCELEKLAEDWRAQMRKDALGGVSVSGGAGRGVSRSV